MRRGLMVLVSLPVLLGFGACTTMNREARDPASHERKIDSWYLEPKQFSDYLHIKGTAVPEDRIFEVSDEFELEAERALENESVVAINNDRAKKTARNTFKATEGYTPFLVRGLFYSKATGKWRVYQHGERLQVAHNSLGGGQAEMRRQALVILLQSKPTVLYTFCSAVQ